MMLKNLIKKWANYRSYKKAVKEAKRRRAKDFKKYLVVYFGGEFRVFSKQYIKDLHKVGALKCKVSDFEKNAVFTTH